MKLHVASRIRVKDQWWDLSRTVLEAHLIGRRIIVVYEEASYPEESSNLVALNTSKEVLWVAENPTGSPVDTYSRVVSESPLKVANIAGLSALIDVETGKIRKIIFSE